MNKYVLKLIEELCKEILNPLLQKGLLICEGATTNLIYQLKKDN